MKKYISKLRVFQVAIVFVAFSCSEFDPATSTSSTISTLSSTDVLAGNGYTVLVDAIEAAGLTGTIDNASSVTIFAPTNIAFSNLLSELGASSISEVDQATLAGILSYHVVTSDLASDALTASMETLEGSSIYLSNGALNAKANIIETDLVSASARVHGIDAVLSIPSSSILAHLAADDNYDLIAYAAELAGLNATLSGSTELTVLAPNDAAFRAAGLDSAGIEASTAEALTATVLFHTIAGRVYSLDLPASGSYVVTQGGTEADGVQEILVGDGPRFNGVSVESPNINTGNGVIHGVGSVIGSYFTMSGASGLAGPVDGAFGATGIGFANFFNLVNSTSYADIYDLSRQFNIYVQLFGPSDVSQFATEADAIQYITDRVFEGSTPINGLANGTKITAVSGSSYYVATTASGGEYVNGGSTARNAFGATSGTNYGSVLSTPFYKDASVWLFSSGAFVPLPSTDLPTTIAAVDSLSLFAAALEVTGLATTAASGDHTIFAVNNTDFTSYYGYTTAAEVTAAGADAFDELSNHVIPNDVQFGVVVTTDRPSLTALSGEALQVTTINDGSGSSQFGFIGDPTDINGSQYIITGTDGLASNGVIHVIDGVIVIAE